MPKSEIRNPYRRKSTPGTQPERRAGSIRISRFGVFLDFGFWILDFVLVLVLALPIHAQDASTQPTAQVTHGARMKLIPAKTSILESQDPLEDITGQMTDVLGDLAAQRTNKPVQAKQQEVVENLDTVIKLLEQQKSGNGGGSLNPTKPMSDSVIAGGPGGIHGLKDPSAGTRNFGRLPPKDRDAILQSKTEGFPPGYESLLQSYYQRLAQEKTTGDNGSGGGATPPKPASP
jgi:hypothetical protein